MNRDSGTKTLQLTKVNGRELKGASKSTVTPLHFRIGGIIGIAIVVWGLAFALMIGSEAKVVISSAIAGGAMMFLLIKSVKDYPKYWFGEEEGGN
ncbi:hypothetical protein AB4455_06455 [Vibrio sp. 10N.261.46.E12]|nr:MULTISPECIES: hypothetical protein [unclassified Vibrio]OMO37199.1 hypothetical protein BH584_23825 [Vibrio sp. 10N.261.45.E1]PMJ25768.1 hypothetical protein BCU27_09910 [Vibrio sp. 10N.286.45.B6]PML84437.1 hypothetical protein BCT66_17480 [Vibrio sp. 10N.261.49.E11]PMM90175.1 hypothetical protein BCT46_23705 [Vibrio sp. 10N.261.46.E8]PMN46138.1 hypothetical protein BCT32_11125 [Vibrio sp. 10N.261.45.E11]